MDPLSLFGIAAGVTFAGYSLAFGLKEAIRHMRNSVRPPSPQLYIRDPNIPPNSPIPYRLQQQLAAARPPSPIPLE